MRTRPRAPVPLILTRHPLPTQLFMRAAIIAGSPPDSRALTSLALAITSCRLAWAQQLLAAGEAVWGQQRGPQRVLVLLPLMQLDLLPETPEPLRLQVRPQEGRCA